MEFPGFIGVLQKQHFLSVLHCYISLGLHFSICLSTLRQRPTNLSYFNLQYTFSVSTSFLPAFCFGNLGKTATLTPLTGYMGQLLTHINHEATFLSRNTGVA
jgi:hypothetical protein